MLKIKTSKKTAQENINDEEILLLATKVVRRYSSKGSIPKREVEDVTMSIVEKFLLKKLLIQKNFQGKAKFSTYCISVLNNMCCEIIRREMKHWSLQDSEQYPMEKSSDISSMEKLAIIDEIRYLHKIILLFGDKTPKVRLFTAYYLYLTILESDIKSYDNEYIRHKLLDILSYNKTRSKGETFNKLSFAANIVENSNTKADAVRMWLNKTSNTIIERLNSGSESAYYNIETYYILFEYYYTGFDNKIYNININKL